MAVTVAVAALACGQLFGKVCALGRAVPPGTPAAGFLASAARLVDEAAGMLHRSGEHVPTLRVAAGRLSIAEGLLRDVAVLHGHPASAALDRLTVVVQGLSIALDPSSAPAARTADAAADGAADATGGES